MKRYKAVIQPQTAFITPLLGDTLFGQCCWALRNQHGEKALIDWLKDYTANQPFMVVSNAFIEGYIARPTIPLSHLGFQLENTKDRKAIKSKTHIPLSVVDQPLHNWGGAALSDSDIEENLAIQNNQGSAIKIEQGRTHNSINRLTGTTGSEGFAPYDRQLTWYHPDLKMAIYIVVDETRIQLKQVEDALIAVGLQGFGKEASSGLGKFIVNDFSEWQAPMTFSANAWYALAPSAPQGLLWQQERCFYQPFVRFGRHGDLAVHTGNPFKNPVMMTQSGAIFTPQEWQQDQYFIGQGLTDVSKAIVTTVQQGYAPVLEITM